MTTATTDDVTGSTRVGDYAGLGVPTQVGGLSVHRFGSGSIPVVLLHGWCADALTNWHQAVAHLDAYDVIAPDLPGHGASAAGGKFSIQGAADAVAEMLDVLDVGPATVCGYSMGGPVSQCLARSRGDLVGGLVQIATAARLLPSAWQRQLLPVAAHVGRLGFEAAATLAALAPRGHDLGRHALGVLRSCDKGALVRAAGELSRYDARPWLGELDIPAVSVITVRDRAVPPEAQRELADLLSVGQDRRATLDTGHLACLQPTFGTTVADALAHLSR